MKKSAWTPPCSENPALLAAMPNRKKEASAITKVNVENRMKPEVALRAMIRRATTAATIHKNGTSCRQHVCAAYATSRKRLPLESCKPAHLIACRERSVIPALTRFKPQINQTPNRSTVGSLSALEISHPQSTAREGKSTKRQYARTPLSAEIIGSMRLYGGLSK